MSRFTWTLFSAIQNFNYRQNHFQQDQNRRLWSFCSHLTEDPRSHCHHTRQKVENSKFDFSHFSKPQILTESCSCFKTFICFW